MLLFVKKIHADRLRAGQKTVEIRAGARYRNIRIGDSLSINGQFRLRVNDVQCFSDSASLLSAVPADLAGFQSAEEFRIALLDCYGEARGPFFAFSLSPSSAIKNPPSEQYSIAFE